MSGLFASLADGWGFDVQVAEYAPVGAGSYHWVVTDSSGTRAFVTVDDLDRKKWLGDTRESAFDALRAAFDTAMIVGAEDIPTGENLILSASFEKEGMEPTCTTGTLALYHGETKVGEGKLKTQLGAYAIAGSGLYVGRHSREAVTDDYPGDSPYAFTGGTINRIAVDVSGDAYVDLEREAEMLIRSQ